MTYPEAVLQFKRQYWIDLLERCDQDVWVAAWVAGVNRTHAYQIINVLGIPYAKCRRAHRGNWRGLRG
jgi:hypothetical protein